MKLNKKKILIEKKKKPKHYSNEQCFARRGTVKSPHDNLMKSKQNK